MVSVRERRQVGEFELRKLFNDGRYYERMQAGEFWHEFSKRQPVVLGGEAVISEIVSYREKTTSHVIATVHQYRRKDGSLGASGKPDPKFLIHNGVPYTLKRKKRSPPP